MNKTQKNAEIMTEIIISAFLIEFLFLFIKVILIHSFYVKINITNN